MKSSYRSYLSPAIFVVVITLTAGCSGRKVAGGLGPGSGGGQTNTSASNSNSASSPPSANAASTPTTWEATATSLKITERETVSLACPPNGTSHSVWGSDFYTTDSSICTAAVHSGLITFEQGGTVTIWLRPGRKLYGASERNGVTSGAYGPWDHSFVFKTPNTDAVMRAAEEATAILWTTSATPVGFEVGQSLTFRCPAGGKEGSVWGTDVYTLDSSICTAAVHAGKIQLESGGVVTIDRKPGESSYHGSTRNGIKSNDYGPYGSSFIVR